VSNTLFSIEDLLESARAKIAKAHDKASSLGTNKIAATQSHVHGDTPNELESEVVKLAEEIEELLGEDTTAEEKSEEKAEQQQESENEETSNTDSEEEPEGEEESEEDEEESESESESPAEKTDDPVESDKKVAHLLLFASALEEELEKQAMLKKASLDDQLEVMRGAYQYLLEKRAASNQKLAFNMPWKSLASHALAAIVPAGGVAYGMNRMHQNRLSDIRNAFTMDEELDEQDKVNAYQVGLQQGFQEALNQLGNPYIDETEEGAGY
jgi:actin-related protein